MYDLIAVAIALCGLGLIIKIFVILYFYQVGIKKWIITTGEVLKSEVVYYKSKTDADTEGWKHRVTYRYVIDGTTYLGNKITKNIGYLSPSENLTGGIPFNEGQEIKVFYNPKNPQEAILDNKFNYNSLVFVVIGIAALYLANLISTSKL